MGYVLDRTHMHTQTIKVLNNGYDPPCPKKIFASSLGAWPIIKPPFTCNGRVSVFTIYRHDLTGSTHFYKYDGRSYEKQAQRYSPCQIIESEDFSDFTPRQRNYVCKLDSNWWVGSKICSLLSAHHLIGAYFLTTKSDKHVCVNQTLWYPILVVGNEKT